LPQPALNQNPRRDCLSPTPTKRSSLQPDEFRQSKPVNPRGLVQLNKRLVSARFLSRSLSRRKLRAWLRPNYSFDLSPEGDLDQPADSFATSGRAQGDFPSLGAVTGPAVGAMLRCYQSPESIKNASIASKMIRASNAPAMMMRAIFSRRFTSSPSARARTAGLYWHRG
jgi:hypothetical protein